MIRLHEYLTNDQPSIVATGISLMPALDPTILIEELVLTLKTLKRNRHYGSTGLWQVYGKQYALGRLVVNRGFGKGGNVWVNPIRIWSDGHINRIKFWALHPPDGGATPTTPRSWQACIFELKYYPAIKTKRNSPTWRYLQISHIPDIIQSFQWTQLKEFDGYSEAFDFKFDFIL